MYFLYYLILLFSTFSIYGVDKLYYEAFINAPKPILNEREKKLVKFIEKAIDNSERHISILPQKLLSFGGTMTSPRSRHFLNNICSLSGCRYLEIGTHRGASLISALYNNKISYAYSIDNFSEFGNVETELHHNIQKYIPKSPLKHLTADAFSIDPSSLPKFNIYFYDGNHAIDAQKKAFIHFNECLDDVFIAIVDDWMWEQVRSGTFQAFTELGYNILFEKELALRFKDDVPWRYLYVCLIKKP